MRTSPTTPALSGTEALILELLHKGKAMYGLELVAGSKRRLKRGTVYVTLGRMERKGYITSKLEDVSPPSGGLRRRLYEPTTFGRRALAASAAWARIAQRLAPEFAQ